MISARANVISELHSQVSGLYHKEFGMILSQPYTGLHYNQNPELATKNDMEEIARLVCSDKGIGGHYTPEELKAQFISRFDDGTGRNYVIRKEQIIVAHYATYAEIPEIAVMGGLIVLPEERGNGFARLLHCYLSDLLITEKREAVLFCHDRHVLNMYLKMGAVVRSEYGKMVLKNKD
jgi:predicted GNAT family acetyltransferase